MALAKANEEYTRRYTYQDYAAWDDVPRCELIDGRIYMAPAPLIKHQDILYALYYQLRTFLRGKPCKVLGAPVDVRLNHDKEDNTVVQPDLLVVCDRGKLDGKCCLGAPDMVVEILSPSTAKNDRILKFNQYRKAGVREYWIVDPDTNSVQTHILQDSEYVTRVFADEVDVPVTVLEGCVIHLAEVFAED